jgi:hypothetical protein
VENTTVHIFFKKMEKKKERKIVGQELLWLYRVLFTTNHKSWFSSREGR